MTKTPYVDEKVYKKVQKIIQTNDKKVIKTWARSCTIIPEFIGFTFLVHNGKKFIPVYVTEQMIGHKLGEFSPTRIFRGHGEAHTKEASELT